MTYRSTTFTAAYASTAARLDAGQGQETESLNPKESITTMSRPPASNKKTKRPHRPPPPPPTTFAPRKWAAGEAVRVLRRRDGRKGADATVRSHDGDSVRLLFDNGSEADVPAGYDARRAVVRRPDRTVALPEDCVRHVAGFLSAKRALRAAGVAAAWKNAARHDGDWRRRVAARWPYEVAGAVASWRDVYRRRLSAERALRDDVRAGVLPRRLFAPRLCANPCCAERFLTRRDALAHHRVHPHSWLGIDFDDEVWLNDRARGIILYRDDRKRELQVHAMEILEHRPISPTIGLCANFDM